MKKIICLVICIACIMTMLASCGAEKCEAHVDADKNSACDNCGIPVYTVIEKVPTEEEIVDMIVSAIPNNSTIGSIWAFEDESEAPVGELVKVDALDKYNDAVDKYQLDDAFTLIGFSYTTQVAGNDTTEETWDDELDPDGYLLDDEFKDTTVVYNILAGKTVYEYTTDVYTLEDVDAGHVDDVEDIKLVSEIFIEAKIREYTYIEEDEYWDWEIVYEYYLIDGTKLSTSKDTNEDGSRNLAEDFDTDDEFAYVTIGNTRYAYDLETCKVVGQGDADSFVYRPEFDFRTDAYGYVEDYDKVYVFDLTKWLECVYSYEIPSGADYWVLANGNILIQKDVILPESAKNYDYTDGVRKYDITYTMVDVAAKTETAIEFGYYILDVDLAEDGEGYAASVKNLLTVYEIENKNLGDIIYLACDDSLGIIADKEAALPEFVNYVTAIADGVFLGTVQYGEGSSVSKLFDANGNVLATLPSGVDVYPGAKCIELNGKYYDFTMNLIFDPLADEEAPFSFIAIWNEFSILSKGDDYYYWNASLEAPVMIAKATNVVVAGPDEDPIPAPNPIIEQELVDWYEPSYFVIKTTTTTAAEVEGDPDEITYKYEVFNSANQLILESETAVDVNADGDYAVALDQDGHYYIAIL